MAWLASCGASGFIAQRYGKGIFDAFKIKQQIKKKQLFTRFRCAISSFTQCVQKHRIKKQLIEKQFWVWRKKQSFCKKQEPFPWQQRTRKIAEEDQ